MEPSELQLVKNFEEHAKNENGIRSLAPSALSQSPGKEENEKEVDLATIYADEKILDDPWKDEDEMNGEAENVKERSKSNKLVKSDYSDESLDESDDDETYRAPIMDSRNVRNNIFTYNFSC